MRTKLISVLALGLLAAGSASAGNVYWSVGVHAAPGVTIGVGHPPPVYVAPAPVYVAPPRVVYVQPAPIYYEPYVYGRPVVITHKVKHHRHWHRRHH